MIYFRIIKIILEIISSDFEFRSIEEQDEAIRLLEHLTFINNNAKEAVGLGDGTLKEANNTYHTLAGLF